MYIARLWPVPAVLAGFVFGLAHAGLQWVRGGLVDPVLAALSGLAVALAWLGPSLLVLNRVRPPHQRWVARQTGGHASASRTGDRFDKFTERARKVLQYAQEEAQRFNHTYIGTEHLLLGLVREGEGVAAKVLVNLGVDLNTVRSSVEFIIGRGDHTQVGDIGLTPRAKKVIELAVQEASGLNHHYIGTEHLLLGLVREGGGIAAGILESHGVSLERVREQVLYVLNQSLSSSRQQVGDRVINFISRLINFNEGARRAMQLAQEEAIRFQHASIGTEHVLLGLLAEGHGPAALALGDVGLDLEKARQGLASLDGEGEGLPPDVVVGPMMEQAMRAAFERNAQEIGTEHLLLGLLATENSAGVRLLERLGTTPEAVRAALERRLASGS